MAKNLVSGQFGFLCPKFGSPIFFFKLEKMVEKPSFWPDFDSNLVPPEFFSLVLPLLDVVNFCKLSLRAISRKTNEPNLGKWQKTYF